MSGAISKIGVALIIAFTAFAATGCATAPTGPPVPEIIL
jgi:hypothetical protein